MKIIQSNGRLSVGGTGLRARGESVRAELANRRAMLRAGPFSAWWPLVVLGFVSGYAPAVASETGTPQENYRVLEWQDLVPSGWEPPMVPRAYDEVSEADIDETSVVKDLNGQLAALPGYMKPVVYEGNQVTEFLLVPFLPHQVSAHAHLEPNQMVYVYALEPVIVERPSEPIWIVGTMTLEPVMTDEGPAAYRMVEAVTTQYEY